MSLITINKKNTVDLKMSLVDLNDKPYLFKLRLQCRDVLSNGKVTPEYTISNMPSLSSYGAIVSLVMLVGFVTTFNSPTTVKLSNELQRITALGDDVFVRLALSNFAERFGINLMHDLTIPALNRINDECYINLEFVVELHARFKAQGHTFKWND